MAGKYHLWVLVLGTVLPEQCFGFSIFLRTDFVSTLRNHGAATTHVKVATMTSARSSKHNTVQCVSQCLQQVACRHVHSTTSTCYLLGTDALIGQDTAHTLQPSDRIYTSLTQGTNTQYAYKKPISDTTT